MRSRFFLVTPIFIFFPLLLESENWTKRTTLDKKRSFHTSFVSFLREKGINSAFVLGKVKKRAFEEERCLSH